MKPNEKGGAGYLGYEDKTFTISTAPDQWILAPITQPITNPMNEPAQPTPVGKALRYLSVCSGMEAASVAWHPLGWTPVGFSEIEPFPCAILKHRFPNTPNYGSLTEYKQWPLEPGAIDLLVGGTPCQSFSVAGLRKGLEDPRGNLALVFLGLADKLKPRWIVWENVPGVLSSAGGRDFGSFLGALVELGYGFAYRVLDAQHFGVPQRRRRVFVVACLGDWHAPAEVLLESDCVRRDPKKGRAKGQSFAAGAEGGIGADGQVAIPFRKSKRACSTTDNETWIEADASNTLNNFDLGDTRTTHAVVSCSDVSPTISSGAPFSKTNNERVECEAFIVQASELRLRGQITEKDVCPTPTAGAKQGDTDPLAVHAIAFQPGNLMRKAGADPSTEVFPTLTKDSGDQSPHVACPQGVDPYNQTLTGDIHVPLRTAGGHGAPACTTPMAVRRLTPVECERLQGFPDNWSRINWKGKSETECPDGPRYKACGNSMAVPVMRWIGERIAAADAKHFPPTP